MSIMVYLGHPAHVHFYKNILRSLERAGWDYRILARPKDVTLDLLISEGLPYIEIGRMPSNRLARAANSTRIVFEILREIRRFRPRVLGGVHNEVIAVAGRVANVPSAVFVDSETVPTDPWLTYPFADVLWSPEFLALDLGPRHVRFPGFKELAYLHPGYFTPDPQVVEALGLDRDDPYVLLRWIGWKADHDRRHQGLSPVWRERIVRTLSRYMSVFVSSEEPLPHGLRPFGFPLAASRLHDALAFARLAFTDGQTFATEAAVLGVPCVRSNSLASAMSNFRELESRYGLLFSTTDPRQALDRAEQLALEANGRSEWQRRRRRLLADKGDMVAFGASLYAKLADTPKADIPSMLAALRQQVSTRGS